MADDKKTEIIDDVDNQLLDNDSETSSDTNEESSESDSDNQLDIEEDESDSDSEELKQDSEANQIKEHKSNKHQDENFKEKIVRLFKIWWNNKKLRYSTLAGLGIIMVLIILIPNTRYFVLNGVGVRASASITVNDESSKFPLKNVQVSLNGMTVKTDVRGVAKISGVRLGKQKLTVSKRAFAEINKNITVGWGSNPLGKVEIKPVGAQYTFYLTDWLSGKSVNKGEAVSGEFNASADKDGKILLTIDPTDNEDLDVDISSNGYRTEKIKLNLSNKAKVDVKLVSKRKHPFFSRREGTYDLYKIDVDGKNEQLVLKGTGLENPALGLVPNTTADVTAVASTRDNVRNSDGYLLTTLNLIDLTDNSIDRIAQSEAIKIYGWSGDKLVYVQTIAGTSAANPKRNRLISYDYKTKDKKELASANAFNGVLLIGRDVYYAPGNAYALNGNSNFYRVNIDGTNQTTLLGKEVWNFFRTNYETFNLSVVNQEWYNYKLGDDKAFVSPSAPTNYDNRQYLDNPSGKKSLWTEDRDGKGTLILYDIATKGDKVLKQQAGLKSAIRWLDDTKLVYRIQTSEETADYVMNIDGGEAVKIRDVTQSTPVY